MLLGVDVGGTFTDAVLLTGGPRPRLLTAKVPTTPDDQARGVLGAAGAVLRAADLAGDGAGEVRRFAHGTTVGTNALLERRGACTALLATEGFTDLIEIARQDRASLYDLAADRPPPLAAENARIGVKERNGATGVVTGLTREEVQRVTEAIGALVDESGVESVAICLLFSYAAPEHERMLAAAIRRAYPDLHVSSSSEVLPQFREYERCSTTVVDAYLTPLLSRYIGRLREQAADAGLPEPLIMRSSGGVTPAEEAIGGAAWSVLSGPAGGAMGAALLARRSGDGNALGFDMGGTSCDVCVVEGGEVRRTDSREIAGRPIQLPMVDVHTVGAGGGSIAWADGGGALRVGPRSAGADPGPACYGNGGAEPTVTDANLVLGMLPPGGALAGGVGLDLDAAGSAVAALGEELGLDVVETARGIVAVANQEMIRALRVVTVERGVDPRDFTLLPFGGAGPLHAAAIADELGIERILCPRSGGVLSALGMAVAGSRRDTARTVMLTRENLTAEAIAAAVAELQATIRAPAEALWELAYDLRYEGQSFELTVPGTGRPAVTELREGFERAHEALYGYRDPHGRIELVNIRAAASEPTVEVDLNATSQSVPERDVRGVHFDLAKTAAAVLRGEPPVGFQIDGPAILELPETTFALPPGWSANVDESGSILATRRADDEAER